VTSTEAIGAACPICAKHRGTGPLAGGPLIWHDEHVLVFHRPPDATGRAFLGYLFIESRRHVPVLDQLTDAEAAAVGQAAARAARAIRQVLHPEYVFAAIVGRGVAHFHQHVFARHRGTPDEFDWMTGDRWGGAPYGDAAELDALAERLRPHFPA
jgi:diadenosine tetraphosphate (Ap4A) HIT family hydrolase